MRENGRAKIFRAYPHGTYKGFTNAKWLPDLIFECYRLSGRHDRTGRPFKNTIEQLGVEEFIESCQLDQQVFSLCKKARLE